MKFNQKIEIDLLNFIKTRQFDYLELNQNREWILNYFQNPVEIYITGVCQQQAPYILEINIGDVVCTVLYWKNCININYKMSN